MRRAEGALLLALFLLAAAGVAADPLPWFDVERIPGEMGQRLARYRALACGPVDTASLPLALPGDARLVFISCHGGPYACPARDQALAASEEPFTCPASPTGKQIATMHLISRRQVAELGAFYRGRLADGFQVLEDAGVPALTFVETTASGGGHPWSPKRLQLGLSPARGAFSDAGYRSQIRITLSLTPPSAPRTDVFCRLPLGLYSPDEDPGRPGRYRSRREDFLQFYSRGCTP